MADELAHIDPAWAWQPFEPGTDGPWDPTRAAHLFRRAGFGATSEELDEAAGRAPAAVVTGLVEGGPGTAEFDAGADRLTATVVSAGGPEKLAATWLYRMLGSPHPLREKMTLFWHGHFATSGAKVTDSDVMQRQNDLLRRYALGDFAALALEISRDPAMLIYLDSATNRKAHPNENYARELMELFCLGEGNYTEHDVREVARCFTGWGLRRDKFRFNAFEHDDGEKSFLGASGRFGGEDAVRVVLEQPACGRFIARKLFRWFVCDEPAPPDALIEPLAEEFRGNGMNVAALVTRILGSRLFFSEAVVGRKVRSPAELAVGLLRTLNGSTDLNALGAGIAETGQSLYYPPNVKGWDGGRAWIDSSTLLGRANLVRRLLENGKTRFDGSRLDEVAAKHVSDDPAAQVAWLSDLLLAVPLSEAVRDRLVAIAGDNQHDRNRRLKDVVHAMSTLPEFQLS